MNYPLPPGVIIPSPNNPGNPVDDLAFTMFVLEQEGAFDEDDDDDEDQD